MKLFRPLLRLTVKNNKMNEVMKKAVSFLAMAIFCVAALSSCVEVNMSSEGKKIKPSSNFKTVEYQQKEFHEIDLNIVATVEFVQGNESKVVLTAPDNYIELFKFENKDGELDVAFARRNINIEGKNVHLTIYSPTLSSLNNSGVSNVSIKKLTAESLELDNSGVGSINIKDLQAKTVDVDCSGVGNVTLAGSAASADLDCSGVGSIHAADLEAQTVEADVSGVGGIQCWATESIKGDVSGVGSLKYKGEPKAKDLHRSGVGKVSQL